MDVRDRRAEFVAIEGKRELVYSFMTSARCLIVILVVEAAEESGARRAVLSARQRGRAVGWRSDRWRHLAKPASLSTQGILAFALDQVSGDRFLRIRT
jgi:hypothetical protein